MGITMWLYTDRMYTVLIQLIRRLLVFDDGYSQNKLRVHKLLTYALLSGGKDIKPYSNERTCV